MKPRDLKAEWEAKDDSSVPRIDPERSLCLSLHLPIVKIEGELASQWQPLEGRRRTTWSPPIYTSTDRRKYSRDHCICCGRMETKSWAERRSWLGSTKAFAHEAQWMGKRGWEVDDDLCDSRGFQRPSEKPMTKDLSARSRTKALNSLTQGSRLENSMMLLQAHGKRMERILKGHYWTVNRDIQPLKTIFVEALVRSRTCLLLECPAYQKPLFSDILA
ncbi:unnamed protein product, partial [Mesorhabditis belari]|uniref:Uncharacterized protein n=1 Tax=Mesorhabditis belari TaxID=2138241 RepID=A0AAF3J3C7_9BILA